jgi:hypothetical protein
MDNPQTQATLATRHRTLNTVEHMEWTIHSHRKHWQQDTEQRQTKQKIQYRKLKK